jgi:hypothetical protein
MRAEKIEEEQRRRQTIVAAKVEKETALLQKLRNISRLRCVAPGSNARAIMATNNYGQFPSNPHSVLPAKKHRF